MLIKSFVCILPKLNQLLLTNSFSHTFTHIKYLQKQSPRPYFHSCSYRINPKLQYCPQRDIFFFRNYAYDYWGWYPFIHYCLQFVTSLIQILEKCFYNILIEFHISRRLVTIITARWHEIHSNIRTVKHVSDAFLAKNIFHLDNGVSGYTTKQLRYSIPFPEANILSKTQ